MAIDASTLGLFWGIISVIAGILVIAFPHIISYLIGIYLLIIGALAIIGYIL